MAVAASFWPGLPMFDTVAQYQQVLSNEVDDWHPPIMVRLWQALHGLAAGTSPMFALQLMLYAAGFGLLVHALAATKRLVAALFAGILGVSPLLLGWEMVVLKDTQMLGALVAATGLIAAYRLRERSVPFVIGILAAVLIGYATLLRGNGLFATVPLAVLLLPSRERPMIALGIAAVLGIGVLAALPSINRGLLGAEPSDVEKSQPIFDLAAIARRTPADPFPFTRGERSLIVARHCDKAFFWDALRDPAGCPEATDRLLDEPSGELYRQLGRQAAAHPLAYTEHRLEHWNSSERWLVPAGLPEAAPPDEAEPNDAGLNGPRTEFAADWEHVAADEAGTPLGWPILWTFVGLMLLPIAWHRRAEPAGSLALALCASALTLEASFLVVSIASDLRYHLWSMTALALSLILLADGSLIASRRRATLSAAVLALLIAGGLFTRATLPTAPEDYGGMIRASNV